MGMRTWSLLRVLAQAKTSVQTSEPDGVITSRNTSRDSGHFLSTNIWENLVDTFPVQMAKSHPLPLLPLPLNLPPALQTQQNNNNNKKNNNKRNSNNNSWYCSKRPPASKENPGTEKS